MIFLFFDPGPSEAGRHGGGRRTKNLQGEREKRKRREEKEKRGERKERRKRKERERSSREKDVLCLYGCKTPPENCQKIIKDTKRGGVKKLKKQEERKRRQKRPEKKW